MAKDTNNGALTSNGARKRVHAVIDGKRVPLDRAAALRIAQQTHLLALGDPQRAAEMLAEAQQAERANGAGRTQAVPVDAAVADA
jgi:hypothetical protein